MTRISLTRVRSLLSEKLWRDHYGVVASIGGGWFIRVPS